MNLPNFLSLLRILAVPAFIWLVSNGELVAGWILFAAAGVTDALDGYLAKRLDQVTELGSYLDPLADKLLLVSGFVVLTVEGLMPLWLTLAMVTREILILVGALVVQLLTGHLRMEPLKVSKVNTVAQIVTVWLVLFSAAHGGVLVWAIGPLLWFTLITTVVSGLMYVFEWSRRVTEETGGFPPA
ncbi:MAG: CDP-diacylglycerol--glycerol-3-phosphate 3-phosphatidyltransferase [Magnetococcales bacterium]|nr:CDP-diacylglycerol--glycerol-3-phosphate 3-phosphatidyltransferase [Magnetococcales bacterium]